MRDNNVLGIIFSAPQSGTKIPELTDNRTLGSVPFGGKYRLIDFPISNMVNSGIDKIAVVIKSNYNSLMDHLGSGKSWGLSRRRGGLILLPPFIKGNDAYGNRIETLNSIRGFIADSQEDYVLMCDCGEVSSIDYRDMIAQHLKTGADITVSYKNGKLSKSQIRPLILDLDKDSRITDILVGNNENPPQDDCDYALYSFLIGKDLLLKLVDDCFSRSMLSFKKDILQSNVKKLKIFGYKYDGFDAVINDAKEFFDANMSLMSSDVRDELFNPKRPVYTKVRDDMPSKYGLGSSVRNSLVAQGCLIEGEVENSVIFKGVYIGKGAKVSNCVIMQDTVIEDNCSLKYVICDKDCKINKEKSLNGYLTYPMCIIKGSEV